MPSTFAPLTSAKPALGCSRPDTTLSKVDLPQPDGPTMVTMEPSGTSSETPRTASTARGRAAGILCQYSTGGFLRGAGHVRCHALLTAGFQRNSRASILRMTALNSHATTASVTSPANTAAVLKFAAPLEIT